MIYKQDMIMPGVPVGAEGVLPVLRNLNEHRKVKVHKEMPTELKESMGRYCGERVLPYRMQNNYHRRKSEMSLETIVLENDVLKATFLPGCGGRLYSLYNKKLEKELFYVNPVFQPGNLALRGAWFSGGVEWNMGHFGHTFLTCDRVHFGKCVDENGCEFLRLHEYERVKRLFYQIDFHLPDGLDQLCIYVRIFNTNDEAVPVYYWSNTAASELNKGRVFSSTNKVVYIKPYFNEKGEMVNTFALGELPFLEGLEGDLSYPRNFDRANEYFYQTASDESYPWEAIGYDDGFVFYELSSMPLRYRKMFCWGTHRGGTKWQEYLSVEGGDKYTELQAGLFPTQLNSEPLGAHSDIAFMQVFGGKYVQADRLYQNLTESSHYVKGEIFSRMDPAALECDLRKGSEMPLSEVLYEGHSYGALEIKRLGLENKLFPVKTMKFSETDSILNTILEGKPFDIDLNVDQPPFMIDLRWRKYFERYDNEYAILNLALMAYEALNPDQAIEILEKRKREDFSSLYFRTLACMLDKVGKKLRAYYYYDIAYIKMGQMRQDHYASEFLTEYLAFLYDQDAYEMAWKIYKKHRSTNYEEFNVQVAKIALELEEYDVVESILKKPLERIREGDTTLVELWYQLKAKQSGTAIEEMKKNEDAPAHLDFRML